MHTAARILAPLLITLGLLAGTTGTATAVPPSLAPANSTGVLPVTHDGPVIVQLNAPAKSWKIRHAARAMDAQLPNVTVRTSGDCATADVCVTVAVGWWGPADMLRISEGYVPSWAGLTTYPTSHERFIYLNGDRMHYRTGRTHVAAHEFGHALGLAHHDEYGVMSSRQNSPEVLSAAEVALIEGGIAEARAALATATATQE